MTTKQILLKDRRKELILIAYNHIAKKGFEGLRIRDVAADVGINNATLHYYFPTKEELIRGVVDYLIEGFRTPHIAETTVTGSEDAWEEIVAELEDARRRFYDSRDQFVVYTELLVRSARDPSIASIFRKLDDGWRGYLISIIERGIRQGVFRADLDPDVAATLIVLQIKGFGYHMLGETNQTMVDEVFHQLKRHLESWLRGALQS